MNDQILTFDDISTEEFREYLWANGATVRIYEPRCLNVSQSGGHRITDASGQGHYIPAGWIHLHWRPREGSPIFVK